MMFYNFLADLILVLHFAFICFVVAGAFLLLKWRCLIYLHLPAVIWGMLIEFKGWICPLTPLEQLLRIQGGSAAYQTGFIEHYLLPIIYPSGLTRNIQIGLGLFVLTLNLLIYAWLIFKRKRLARAKKV